PVGTERMGLGIEMDSDHFGQEVTVLTVPLEGELHVRARGVRMVQWVMADVDAPVDVAVMVPNLRETDGAISVLRTYPALTNLVALREVDAHPVVVLQVARLEKTLPA